MSRRWDVEEVYSDPDAANRSESLLMLTINPNQTFTEGDDIIFRGLLDYMLERLDKILLLKQGDVIGGYAALEPILVSNIKVAIKFEVGPQFHRQHAHITLSAIMEGRGSMMHVDCDKVRAFFREQLGYTPYVNVNRKQNVEFDLRRYILK